MPFGELASVIFYTIIVIIAVFIVWQKLLDKKISLKNYRLYISLFCLVAISMAGYYAVNKFFKISLVTLSFMFFVKYLFKENLQKCIITPIFSQIITMISEAIFALVVVLLSLDVTVTLTNPIINMISNIIISIISVFIVKIKIIKKIYNKIINFTDRINYIQLFSFCVMSIMILNILMMSAFYNVKFEYKLIFNILIILASFSIIIYAMKTQNNYNKVSSKYDIAINSLKDYEIMMNKYKIANHENKNLLLTIRTMIQNNESKIPQYIDSIIENKYTDDEKLLFQTSIIPSGGLRATIYSEILKIKENNIDYTLDIDKKLNTIELIELDTNDIINICKNMCVFIDNAIEAVKKLKTKNISINIYIEKDNLTFKVSNNYSGMIELDKLGNEGYTTKGSGHGYGLSLVKSIIENNKSFTNRTEISKKVFTQILFVKYKKSH